MQKVEMPTFAIFWTEEQIAEAQKVIDRINNEDDFVITDDPEPIMLQMPRKVYKDLKAEGYTTKQIKEIMARVYSGETLDSAMQTV